LFLDHLVLGRLTEDEKVSREKIGDFMANAVSGRSDASAYPLFLACALIFLSLWKVDMGLTGSTGLAASGGDNIVATRFAHVESLDEWRTDARLLVSMLEKSSVNPSNTIGIDARNEEVRRAAALALMVYVAGNGARR
jgi:hypothetical protein